MKNLQIASIFFAMFLFVASCHKEEVVTTVDFDLNENFEINYNQLAQLSSDDLQILVMEVLEDSRCPINARCVWEGQVKLNLEIIQNGTKSFQEIIYHSNAEVVVVENFNIQIVNVTPDTQIDEVIELDDYTFTFLITEQ